MVRDSHGSKQNIIPDLLHRDAKLLRGVSGATKNVMDTMDGSYDKQGFVGYREITYKSDNLLDVIEAFNRMKSLHTLRQILQ